MQLNEWRELSLTDVRERYRAYLADRNYSPNTINTKCSDTFYVWKHAGQERFWDVVTSGDYENSAKQTLSALLAMNSKANSKTNVYAYISHLRGFRMFLNGYDAAAIPRSKRTTPIRTTSASICESDLPLPTCEEVEYYLTQWDGLENYHLQEDALNKLFFELAPANTNLSDILLKVSTLNDFYSTNIYSTFPVAKHILSLDIDERLKAGDLALVDDIQKVVIGEKTKRLYSFATKYCSHHNPVAFAIYDSYVDRVLRYFGARDGFASFKSSDLKQYKSFYEILLQFRSFYGLEKYSLKQIDQYLWLFGKEHFKKQY